MRHDHPTRRLNASIGAALLLSLFAACGGAGGGGGGGDAKPVDTATLEQHVQDNFTPDEGVEMTVDCPEALEAKVDATATCTVDDGEGQTGLRFVTTEVDGEEVSFEATPFLDSQTLETTLASEMDTQGYDVSEVVCPDDLDGVQDEITECTASSQGEEGTIEVAVTQVDGLRIGLSWDAVG